MIKPTLVALLLVLSWALPPQNPIIGVYTEDAERRGEAWAVHGAAPASDTLARTHTKK